MVKRNKRIINLKEKIKKTKKENTEKKCFFHKKTNYFPYNTKIGKEKRKNKNKMK